VAVGSGYGETTAVPLIEQWNGTTWSVVPSPNPGSNRYNELYGVSCVTVDFCVAVGTSDASGSHDKLLIEQWNGTSWSLATGPDEQSGIDYDAYDVSCSSPTFCVLAGETYSGSVATTLAARWNGSSWSILTTPNPSTTRNYFNSLDCRSASWCFAVGATQDAAGATVPLIEQWNGSVWSVTTTPTPTPAPSSSLSYYLDAVSCPSTTFCTAVGYSQDYPSGSSLVEMWNGSAWSIVKVPAGPGLGDELEAVSCVGPTTCTAVGSTNTTGSPNDNYITLALSWNGTSWALNPPANPAVDTPGNDYAELDGVSCVGGHACVASGDAYPGAGDNDTTLIESAPITRPGYRFVASDGGVFALGGASYSGSEGGKPLNQPIVGMAATPDGGGYWLVASDGGVFTFGDAVFYGSTGGIKLNKPIVGMASTPDGGGYWLVASDGGIFAFGDAVYFGSTGGINLNKPIVGMATTPSGRGYWLVASDGGIFAFGDALFHGSAGAITLNKPIVGMAATPGGGGYWLVASDGGIFTYGEARFHGSAGAITLNKPIVGMAASPSGQGYWLVAADGGIFTYGDATFHGSTGGITLNKPIVGMAA
jgi:hypothetical protein